MGLFSGLLGNASQLNNDKIDTQLKSKIAEVQSLCTIDLS